ncbi:MAG: transcriptional regulator [Anaerolineales bacterium]|nr:MAG: transcriptional regulator [Anaerolineales bacterium]
MGEDVFTRIRDFRVHRGLTQDELAQAVGVSRQSIISIERGRYTPSLFLALRFAQFFQCSTDELFKLNQEDHYVK